MLQLQQSHWISATLIAGSIIAQPGSPATEDISHLPEVVQHDISSWRERLESAACIKVVCNTDQTWARMNELDEDGSPTLARRERFQTHAWMTPDILWMVVFAYKGDEPDTTTPYTQLLWERETGLVRERYLIAGDDRYQILRYAGMDAYGPADANVADCTGCLYATVLCSWLAGGPRLENRALTVHSIALMREPNLAVVPPDASPDGVWLDVFRKDIQRDRKPEADQLYRRNDLMLLSRDESGLPEVREWRTIVMTDPDDGGATPTQITGITRLSYQFYAAPPTGLLSSTAAFAHDIDQALLRLNTTNVSEHGAGN